MYWSADHHGSKIEGRLNTKMRKGRSLNEVDFIDRHLTTYVSAHMKLFFLDKISIMQFGREEKPHFFHLRACWS